MLESTGLYIKLHWKPQATQKSGLQACVPCVHIYVLLLRQRDLLFCLKKHKQQAYCICLCFDYHVGTKCGGTSHSSACSPPGIEF